MLCGAQEEQGEKRAGGDGKDLREHVQLAAQGSSESLVGIVHVQPSGHQCSSSVEGEKRF